MNAPDILPALPAAAAATGLIFLAGLRRRRTRWLALGWALIALPALTLITYRLWDHYVGPGTFSFWRFYLSPTNMSLLLPLAVVSPPLLAAAEGKGLGRGRGNAASALSCFALAAAMTAVMSDHYFLLAGTFALATSCMVGAAMLRKRGSRRFLPPALLPLALSDLCLALGALFLYLSDPGRGLFFPALPLEPRGKLAAACALMLAAALLRLGCFPLHRWMAGISRGGKDFRLIHLLGVDLVLGTYLLYMVTRVWFRWEGNWIWICFGVSLITLAEVLRELLSSAGRVEMWGLLCAALGAHLALSASPGGQAAAAAARLGLWAGLPALALVHMGSERGRWKAWAAVVGGVSLLGLPPLAGFTWRWMEFHVLAGAFSGGVTVLFLAALPLVFAGALVEGFTALLLPRGDGEGNPGIAGAAALAAGVLLAAFLAALGLYPGTMVDLLMREYGLPVSLPFTSWTTLGWAMLLCSGLAVVILSAWIMRGGGGARRPGAALPGGALPLWGRKRPPAFEAGKALRTIAVCGVALYAGWAAIMVYLAFR
jgi:formate hydrogenlyase subunit 3/multisubunit Na+/H+ antiporter MnhD subunit